jgi:hypothetical protein
MEMDALIKKISALQKKAIKEAIQVQLNEGYSLDDLEIEYDTTTRKNKKVVKSTLTFEVKPKDKTDN